MQEGGIATNVKFPQSGISCRHGGNVLQIHKNDLEAPEKVLFETIIGELTAVDPDKKTPMTTSGKDKLSFDRTMGNIGTTDGGEATHPHYDPKQVLVCVSSQLNVPGLHMEVDDAAQIRSFNAKTLTAAKARMAKSIQAIKDRRGRNLPAYLENKETQEILKEHEAAGSMEEFHKRRAPEIEKTLDVAKVVSMHKAHTLGHNPGVMVSNRQGSTTVVHDGDHEGKVTQKRDKHLASFDRINCLNRDYCNRPSEYDWGDRPHIDKKYTVRGGKTYELNFLELKEAPEQSYVCIDGVTTTFVSQLVDQEGQNKENSTPASEARAVFITAPFIEKMKKFFQGRIEILQKGGHAAMQLVPKRLSQAPKEGRKFHEDVEDEDEGEDEDEDEEEEEGDTSKPAASEGKTKKRKNAESEGQDGCSSSSSSFFSSTDATAAKVPKKATDPKTTPSTPAKPDLAPQGNPKQPTISSFFQKKQ